jgi:hypothetical protein
MDSVMFVRERAGGRDLVIAILPEGSPAWALDLDRRLQWWYPGGSTPEVRRAIAEHWDDLPHLPVVAVSPAYGPHPAVELGRRAEAAADAQRTEPADAITRARVRWGRASTPTRIGLVGGVLAFGIITVSTMLGGPGPAPDPLPVGSDGRTVTVPQAAGASCTVRGELAHETNGRLLVCVPAGRSTPWTLSWRETG